MLLRAQYRLLMQAFISFSILTFCQNLLVLYVTLVIETLWQINHRPTRTDTYTQLQKHLDYLVRWPLNGSISSSVLDFAF